MVVRCIENGPFLYTIFSDSFFKILVIFVSINPSQNLSRRAAERSTRRDHSRLDDRHDRADRRYRDGGLGRRRRTRQHRLPIRLFKKRAGGDVHDDHPLDRLGPDRTVLRQYRGEKLGPQLTKIQKKSVYTPLKRW